MRNLRLPEGMASVTVFEQTYGKNGVIRDIEDHIAREILSHDPRITEFAAGDADDPEEMPGPSGDRHVAFLTRVGQLDRTELFAAGRAMKISLPATSKTDVLREILIRHAVTMPPEELPMLIVGAPQDDGGMKMLSEDHARSPNRGNDSLGLSSQPPGGTASTFSQATLGGSGAPIDEVVSDAPDEFVDHAAADAHEHAAAETIIDAADQLAWAIDPQPKD